VKATIFYLVKKNKEIIFTFIITKPELKLKIQKIVERSFVATPISLLHISYRKYFTKFRGLVPTVGKRILDVDVTGVKLLQDGIWVISESHRIPPVCCFNFR
jgi:hypothetical protein